VPTLRGAVGVGKFGAPAEPGSNDERQVMTHNFSRLKAHILPLSVADDFSVARREWVLFDVEISEDLDECPCGQEIKEHCFIRNRLNQNATHVGNVCINRFIGIVTGNLFAGRYTVVPVY
jgi:hypothetical protein